MILRRLYHEVYFYEMASQWQVFKKSNILTKSLQVGQMIPYIALCVYIIKSLSILLWVGYKSKRAFRKHHQL